VQNKKLTSPIFDRQGRSARQKPVLETILEPIEPAVNPSSTDEDHDPSKREE
jgi:hypothetical protein